MGTKKGDVGEQYETVFEKLRSNNTRTQIASLFNSIKKAVLEGNTMNLIKKYIMHILASILIIMASGLVLIGLYTETGGGIARFLGTNHPLPFKKETIEFIAFGMGGVVATIVAAAVNRRARAQERNNELIEAGHLNDRFQNVTEHLGHQDSSVRIAAFYQFYYLAKDQQDNNFKKSVFEILCSCLRSMPQNKSHSTGEDGAEYPTAECQTLLDVLFDPKYCTVFDGNEFYPDLRKAYLTNAALSHAKLLRANLSNANLSSAKLSNANLSNAGLWQANLSNAWLIFTNLSNANLWGTNLSEAYLIGANFSGAKLFRANLSETNLSSANLSSANLMSADLSGTNLSRANLSSAGLRETQLKNVNLMDVFNIKNADFRGARIGDRPITKDDIPADKGEYYADWNPPPDKQDN